MANDKTTPAPAEPNKRDLVQVIDFKKSPVFITLRQTPTRNIFQEIIGDPKAPDLGRAAIEAHAKAEAKRLGGIIAVFGPQITAYEPPAPAEPQAVGFDFGA